MVTPKISMIVDSGAFSAYTKKKIIDIDQYAEFIKKNSAHINIGVNLDVIIPSDPETSGRESLENFLHLKDKGVKTMPVFHCGEPLSLLFKLMEEAEYIGLSASVVSVQEGLEWYNTIWPHIIDNNGFPVRKFHAFGDTAPITILGYPWYSCDSTTWYVAAGLAGNMLINGKYVRFKMRTIKDSNYIEVGDSGIKYEVWEEALESKGLNAKLCLETEMRPSDAMLIRTYMNACFFLELQEKTRVIDRLPQSPAPLLRNQRHQTGGIPMTDPINIHFVITSSSASRALAVLTQLGAVNLLTSYFYIAERQWNEMIIPYIYDPIKTCKENKSLREQCEILSKFLRKPIII